MADSVRFGTHSVFYILNSIQKWKSCFEKVKLESHDISLILEGVRVVAIYSLCGIVVF